MDEAPHNKGNPSVGKTELMAGKAGAEPYSQIGVVFSETEFAADVTADYVGRSKKVAGPYLDKEGRDMRNGGGTLILEGDKKEYEATGHCSAYSFPDGDFFFCHGYSVPKNGASILVQKKINWTEDGWLTLE